MGKGSVGKRLAEECQHSRKLTTALWKDIRYISERRLSYAVGGHSGAVVPQQVIFFI